ncbi:alpha/beta hydrolase [Rhodococcus rhodnii]|uniref:Hydrolase n=2 Tax=Rhodococcus rhodnii TaxID=38312 RepID=R7WKE9_9NOCA|nr:alpha/beta hydrolase [Rhodococcus rhodnii]EOM74484.1 hydrolase [Rhodococcus rhodnii LMG 5362]TXG89175.1 alpha/beta hydrolase [Rhodococcus rhodnii]
MTDPASETATRWVSRDGIAVDVRGDGVPVVLLHGIGGSARSCAALAELVTADGFRTYCWDAPGYGDSLDPEPGLDHADALLGLFDELGIVSAHVVGTSWGGVIGAAAAITAPERLRSLVLADSTRGSGVSDDKASGMLSRVEELGRLGAPAFAAARASRLVSPRCDSVVAAAVETDMARVRIPGYAAAAGYMARTDLGPALHRITAPTLVVVGEDDIVTGVAESRLLADTIPGARFATILAAGHAAVQERPEAMAAHVLPLLAGVES